MQVVKKQGSMAGWAISSILAFTFGIWEAYGCYQCDSGLATHRAWLSQVYLGLALIAGILVLSVLALLLGRNRDRVLRTMLACVAIGFTPIIVRLLWGPLCELLQHHVY